MTNPSSQGCAVPEIPERINTEEIVVNAPCLVAVTATSVLAFNFSGRVITNCNRIFLVEIVDIVVKGTQRSKLVLVSSEPLVNLRTFLISLFFTLNTRD